MRVLLVSPRFAPSVGGIETFTADLARWLAERSIEVSVLTKTPAERGFDRSRPYEVVRTASIAKLVAAARAADVVHVKAISAVAVAAARVAGRRPVVTHGTHQVLCPAGIAWGRGATCTATAKSPGPCSVCPKQGQSGWTKVRLLRRAAAFAASNVVPSEFLLERLGVPRSLVIPNPVASDAFAAFDGRSPVRGLVAHVGRLGEAKGLDLLLAAIARIPSARLEVAGDGPMRDRLEARADSLGLQERVTFRGEQDRAGVLELLGRAAVACVPSLCDETFGYTAAEAMAAGVPLVVTPRGALRELAGDGRGWVANDMAPASLAEALEHALTDEPEARRRAEVARSHAVAEYRDDAVGERYLAAYARARS
ncbi:MAG TPA: glycosyltransferase family 4 protein [Acidimicrobiales bacterium]|nr:glycosyltransferase family 4 protein [Acidimicrobiales bacterium]